MFSEVISVQNLLISGTCACPGKAIGHVHVWGHNTESQLKEGDVIILLDAVKELPIWAIKISSGIVSCAHTTYSHLTSIAMSLNKPCIVGAVFNCLPENSDTVLIDSWKNVVAHVADDDIIESRMGESETGWFTSVGSKIREKPSSKCDNPLAHILVLAN